ncbi:cuticle protein 19-like [Penaeus japonicus]|uniref:cuticle protein 19-like n=1 Tax=Penaeus japonicus TaxID=27405 RepID=UPI001C7109DB|nr:cuticle protein 19-like [Penaeus japonicus]
MACSKVSMVMMVVIVTMMVNKSSDAQPIQGHYRYPPMPYEFRYGVRDDYYGNDFGHEEESNGEAVRGRYYVLLPDGRRQVVTYVADHQRGYIATISYENVGFNPHASGNRYG